jgi:hypothetical protein
MWVLEDEGTTHIYFLSHLTPLSHSPRSWVLHANCTSWVLLAAALPAPHSAR